MFSKDTLHAWSVILLASVAAGVAAAVPVFPQYSALLVPLAAALATAAGKVTQMARNAPPPEGKDSGTTPPAVAGIILICLGLGGCASLGHFTNPTLEDIASQYCDNYRQDHMADLQDQAKQAGLSLDDVLHAFDISCLIRVKQAGPAGMGAVQLKVMGELQK
jgi:hypothetical protein